MKYDIEPGKVRGVKIKLGSQDYIIPPLNLEAFEQHEDDVRKLGADKMMTDFDRLKIVVNIALSAIRRNYPEIDIQFVKRWIDLGNFMEVFAAIMGQSGLRVAEPGEPTEIALTGTISTPQSSPQRGGNGSISPET